MALFYSFYYLLQTGNSACFNTLYLVSGILPTPTFTTNQLGSNSKPFLLSANTLGTISFSSLETLIFKSFLESLSANTLLSSISTAWSETMYISGATSEAFYFPVLNTQVMNFETLYPVECFTLY
mmetsp:Transcript_14097/g.2050  ORF Transcript_14097/g.2050 Transcript_14097/m.2050 type:complete len:125 (-) Transcript_14097:226-600(-)